MTPTNRKWSVYLPFAGLTLMALVWGYNWVIMKVGVRDCDPYLFAALRNVLGALVLFALVVVRRGPLRPVAFWWTALFGLFQTSFSGFTIWAVYAGGAGKTSVLTYTMPFWILLIAWPVLGERIKGIQWVAVVLAFAGLVLIIDPWSLRGWLASLLAVGGGLSWAIASVLFKIIRRRHEIELLPFAAWQTLLGSLPLLVAALIIAPEGPTWTGTFIAALLYNVVLASGIVYVVWLYVLHSLPAGTAGINSLAIPVVGVLTAWIHLGEKPGALEAVGMALIVVALAILTAREVAYGRQARPPGAAVEAPGVSRGGG
jgi:drug/metabolite transporter (DMT)-like permease